MTRSLPWKKDGAARPRADVLRADSAAQTPISSRSSAPKGTPLKAAAASASKPTSVARHSLSAKRERSPSTSPPPEPPVENFMIDGAENDDCWRMVEDEFLSVANSFTVHLHAAEYHRLKNLAKEQNADTIVSISRPVTGAMTSSVKRRQEILSKLARQRDGLKRARSNVDEPPPDDDSHAPWAGTSLQGLMDTPRKKSMRLAAVTSALSTTRAAAGYLGSSPSKGSSRFHDALSNTRPSSNTAVRQTWAEPETTDESDDLDAPARRQQTLPTSSSPALHQQPHSRNGGSLTFSRPAGVNGRGHESLDMARSPEREESDNPDNGLFLRSIMERRRQSGVRVTVKQEEGE